MTVAVAPRQSEHPVEPLFLERWSPRAFTGEEIPQAELNSIFEAARWAPSSFNSQPWRFLYARRGTPAFDTFLSLLVPFNQQWAQNAAVLVFVVSARSFVRPGTSEPVPARSHSFDAGAAWANLALQATKLGWHAHGMGGIDRAKLMDALGIPDGFRVEAAAAIGKIAPKDILPEDLMKREVPSTRKPVAEFVSEGRFTA